MRSSLSVAEGSADGPALADKKIQGILAVLLGASLALSISGAELAAAFCLIYWAITAFSSERRQPWKKSALDAPILAMYAWGLVSVLINRSTNWWDALGAQDAVLLFFLVAHGLPSENMESFAVSFCVASVASGLLGGLQSISKINYRPDQGVYQLSFLGAHMPPWLAHRLASWNDRSVGTRSHPLTYSEGLIPAFFILMGFLNAAKRKIASLETGIYAAGLIAILWGIVGSQSRGVWLGLSLGLIAFGFLSRYASIRWGWIAILVLAPIVFVTPKLRGRMMSIVSSREGTSSDQRSKITRLDLWSQSRASIKAHPFAGVGLRGANFVLINNETLQPESWSESHNIYLQCAVETGWPGLALLLGVFAGVSYLAWTCPLEHRNALLPILLALAVAGITESWLSDKEVAMIFWCCAGWAARHSAGRGALGCE